MSEAELRAIVPWPEWAIRDVTAAAEVFQPHD
jgi:hypothetical protein